MNKRLNQKGFSLVEVLIAISIAMIGMVATTKVNQVNMKVSKTAVADLEINTYFNVTALRRLFPQADCTSALEGAFGGAGFTLVPDDTLASSADLAVPSQTLFPQTGTLPTTRNWDVTAIELYRNAAGTECSLNVSLQRSTSSQSYGGKSILKSIPLECSFTADAFQNCSSDLSSLSGSGTDVWDPYDNSGVDQARYDEGTRPSILIGNTSVVNVATTTDLEGIITLLPSTNPSSKGNTTNGIVVPYDHNIKWTANGDITTPAAGVAMFGGADSIQLVGEGAATASECIVMARDDNKANDNFRQDCYSTADNTLRSQINGSFETIAGNAALTMLDNRIQVSRVTPAVTHLDFTGLENAVATFTLNSNVNLNGTVLSDINTSGDINVTGGSVGVSGNLSVLGNANIGTALQAIPDSHTIYGSVFINDADGSAPLDALTSETLYARSLNSTVHGDTTLSLTGGMVNISSDTSVDITAASNNNINLNSTGLTNINSETYITGELHVSHIDFEPTAGVNSAIRIGANASVNGSIDQPTDARSVAIGHNANPAPGGGVITNYDVTVSTNDTSAVATPGTAFPSPSPSPTREINRITIAGQGGVELCGGDPTSIAASNCAVADTVYVYRGFIYASSSKKLKENIIEKNYLRIFEKFHDLTIPHWNYKNRDDKFLFGPIAEEFYEEFVKEYKLASSPVSITHRDLIGVTMAALKGAIIKIKELVFGQENLRVRMAKVEAENEMLRNYICEKEKGAPDFCR